MHVRLLQQTWTGMGLCNGDCRSYRKVHVLLRNQKTFIGVALQVYAYVQYGVGLQVY